MTSWREVVGTGENRERIVRLVEALEPLGGRVRVPSPAREATI
jgi:hypothetical protein